MRHSDLKRISKGIFFNRFKRVVAFLLVVFLFAQITTVYADSGLFNADDTQENTVSLLADSDLDPKDTPDDAETGEPGNSQTVTVTKFGMNIIDGYTRTDEDGAHVWEANTSSNGHTFMFNVVFETSGNGMIGAGDVKITVPSSILKDKSDNPADLFQMPVPFIGDIPEDMKGSVEWAYYVDENGDLVITNVKEIPAGAAYNFNLGYTTTLSTYNYEDMEAFDVHAELDFGVPGSQQQQTTDPITVAIDTQVSIAQTNKKKPMELLTTWDASWGPKPEDLGDDYYYLIWEVESLIDEKSTQYYDFSLSDEAADFKIVSPEGYDSQALRVLGYNFAGGGNSYSLEPDTVENQTTFGTRHDFVLTAIPKELYDTLKEDQEIILENKVSATVHPIDDIDADTTASATQTYTLKLPKFTPPIGNYTINKTGNRRTYLLDKFTDPSVDDSEITPFYYDISVSGYSYDKTFSHEPDGSKAENYVPENDPENYGKKKLHYELTDEQVSLEGYVGDFSKGNYPDKDVCLSKGDYYFTSVDFTYTITMVDGFDKEKQSFNLVTATAANEISFTVFGEFKVDGQPQYQKIATVKAYDTGDASIRYEAGMEDRAAIQINGNGFQVAFKDKECTGYKIITSDDLYYSVDFKAQLGIKLVKDNEQLQKWINENYPESVTEDNDDKVTELRVTNTAQLDVDYEEQYKGESPIYTGKDAGTDYQNESARQSAITKSITAASNNTLYKRYEISWRIDVSEYVLVSNTGASRVPVTQHGGEFFDLLPMGSSVELSTVQVFKEDNTPVEFSARTMAGADNRVLLRVTVPENQPGEKYALFFTTYHSWDDISAFGADILNPAAFVTGNEDIANTEYDGEYKRGRYTGDSMDLMVRSINSTGDYDEIERTVNGDTIRYDGDTFDRTIFNYEPFNIKAALMTNVGTYKTVKNAREGTYGTQTVIDDSNGQYSYSLRYTNGMSTKSVNNVFVDFLETFTSANGEVKSIWKGTLRSVDVTNLLSKHIIPHIYYSTDTFIVVEHEVWYVDGSGTRTKLVDVVKNDEGTPEGADRQMAIRDFLPRGTYGNEHWKEISSDLLENGAYHLADPDGSSLVEGLEDLRRITAIVIDLTEADKSAFDPDLIEDNGSTIEEINKYAKVTEDGRYIMSAGEAAYVILNLDNSDAAGPMTRDAFKTAYLKEHPDAASDAVEAAYIVYLNTYNTYNDIFFATDVVAESSTSNSANVTWLEQNYTTVSYRVRGDLYAKKVNVEKPDETISGITFRLYGKSYYGTEVDRSVTTISDGLLAFEELEAGVYTLVETDCGRDWLIDRTEYTVTVHSDSKVTVSLGPDQTGREYSKDDPFVLTNRPRVHADIEFDKRLYENDALVDLGVEGARFMLSGTSSYGTEITKLAVSDDSGRVLFEDVEWGSYQLREVEAPAGYVLSGIVYTVTVDEHGNWQITASDDSLLEGSNSTGYGIGNEKYQEFYLQKISTVAVGEDEEYLLEGAEFHLYGTTENGKTVDVNAVTGFSDVYGPGVAHFGDLEPGTYYLQEITPPVYTYEDADGNIVEQTFHRDETIYTVTVDTDGVQFDPALPNAKIDGNEVDDLHEFSNVPVGGLVIVKKVWIDNLDPKERMEEVKNPDIVISREPPEPFRNVYGKFDYTNLSGNQKRGRLGLSIEKYKNALNYFERYTGAVTRLASAGDGTVTLMIDGKQVTADIVSTEDSEKPIYGWLDESTSTYYWYTEAVGATIPTARDMFTGTKVIKADLAGINFSEAISFEFMFNGCTNLVAVENLTRPANAESTSTERMFLQCTNLGSAGTLDLTGFDTTGITNMASMFQSAIRFTSSTSKDAGVINWGTALHTESVTTFSHMFDTATAMKSLIAEEIDVSGVTATDGLAYVFCNAQNVTSLPRITGTVQKDANGAAKVSMEAMFRYCYKLPSLDLSGLTTAGTNNLKWTFADCWLVTELDLSGFDTSNVTTLEGTFAQCRALTALDLTHFDTSQVTNMSTMFDNCNTLTELDLSSFSMANLKSANTMFCNCKKLVWIYVNRSFDLSEIAKNSGNMFQNDDVLTGGQGTKRATITTQRDYGIYAHIDGGTAWPGYFTERSAPDPSKSGSALQTLASFWQALWADAAGWFSSLPNAAQPYDGTEDDVSDPEPTRTPDSADYRNSANHIPDLTCGDADHFYLLRSQDDLQNLLDELNTALEEMRKAPTPDQSDIAEYEHYIAALSAITLADNEWMYVFLDVVGEGFHAWEENIPAGYEGDFDNYLDEDGETHRITQVENGTATITNRQKSYQPGTLAISKRVLDAAGETVDGEETRYEDVSDLVTLTYTFSVELSCYANSLQNVSAQYYKTGSEDEAQPINIVFDLEGKATVTIQSGYTLKFTDLPLQTKYTVTELPAPDVQSTSVTVTVNDVVQPPETEADGVTTVTGEIEANANILVEYQNIVDVDIRDPGSFTLKKLVVNENGVANPDADYTFVIVFTNLAKNTEYTIRKGDDIYQTFTSGPDPEQLTTVTVHMKADDVLTFDIPADAAYTITEQGGDGYIASYEVLTNGETKDTGSNTTEATNLTTPSRTGEEDATTVFTNRLVQTQTLSVTKTVLGTAPEEENNSYTFVAQFSNLGAGYVLNSPELGTFTADANGNLYFEFYLKAGETARFTNLPVGAGYTIYENYQGELIPCHSVTHTDETTGEKTSENPTPSMDNGTNASEAAAKAQAEVTGAQNTYNTALSVLNYDKAELDSEIAKAVSQLSDEQKAEWAESIAAFTADGFITNPDAYQAARDAVLSLLPDAKDSVEAAEGNLRSSKEACDAANEVLETALAALELAKGPSYASGRVELNRNTDIAFTNSSPYDLTIRKKVTGALGDHAKEFRFRVTFMYNGEPFEGSYTAACNGGARITDSGYENVNASYTFDPGGTVYFVLRHGSTITFQNLPCGTTYTIVEEKAKDYTVTVTTSPPSSDGSMTTGRVSAGSVQEDVRVEYNNHCTLDLPIPTDATTEFGWLVSLLLLSSIGTALLLAGRAARRKGGKS